MLLLVAKWSSELHVGLKEVFLFGSEAHASGKLRQWAGRIKKEDKRAKRRTCNGGPVKGLENRTVRMKSRCLVTLDPSWPNTGIGVDSKSIPWSKLLIELISILALKFY